MTGPWIIAVVLILVCLAVLLPVLLRARAAAAPARAAFDVTVYKDQLAEVDRDVERGLLTGAEAEAARVEVQRRLLAAADEAGKADTDTAGGGRPGLVTAVVVALLVPAGALATYMVLGSPEQPDQPLAARPKPEPQVAQADGRAASLQQAISTLADRLKKNPQDLDGWTLLGRSLMLMSRYGESAQAFAQARSLAPDDLSLRADWAEAQLMADEGEMSDAVRQAFQAVRAGDPSQPKARFYVGADLADRGDAQGALAEWVDMVAMAPPDAPYLPTVTAQIARLAEQAGINPATLEPSAEARAIAAARPAPQPAAPVVAPKGPSRADMEAASEMSAEDRAAMIRSMVERLATRMEENPGDKQGWLRLAQAYEVLGETEKAAEARAKAAALP
ncbi:MAG: c-type cytochrome biogenesis protein CcmI [Rhodobacterales bacterium]|nr:c-type cytochrome biogenesis protein CcmI [Rhodobacterales bacterium]